ncbi:hypothetical protein QBC43DRAFT_351452 [Cladorrhinum sp. PSN259]|nr:hypothetical protein QBC43DRAFT_351452 [Cladorrhinum sp. PSN259]
MVRFRARDLTKREKTLFSHFTIAVVLCNPPAHWNETNIARWISLRGGTCIREGREIDWRALTHMVVDERTFKLKGPKVKEALRINRIHVVALEWLEFSMIQKKVLPVKQYSFRETLKKEREEERRIKEVAKGNELAERAVNTNFYRVYHDQTHFRYELEITREATSDGNEENGPPVVAGEREKYTLTIYESLALPRLYFFLAKFSKSKHDSQPKYYRASETPGLFWQEYQLFKSFFCIKTGVPWDQRLVVKMDGRNEYFQYFPPTGGKPVGWVPPEYVPKEDVEMKQDGVEVKNNATGQMAEEQKQTEVTKGTEVKTDVEMQGMGGTNGDKEEVDAGKAIITEMNEQEERKESEDSVTGSTEGAEGKYHAVEAGALNSTGCVSAYTGSMFSLSSSDESCTATHNGAFKHQEWTLLRRRD